LSFAIPVSVAQEVIRQLKDKGKVERGWLGVYIQDVDKDLARSLDLDKPRGALIAQVIDGSPADEAGIQAGDVIVSFGGRDIVESGELPHQVGLLSPGKEAVAEIIRDGRKRKVTIKVGALPGGEEAGFSDSVSGYDVLGLVVQEMEKETLSSLRITGGVVVEAVESGSAAQAAGLRPGDVLLQLGNVRFDGMNDYRRVLAKIPKGQPVLLRFLRQGQFIFRTIEIEP
jgi:serine protease Do